MHVHMYSSNGCIYKRNSEWHVAGFEHVLGYTDHADS